MAIARGRRTIAIAIPIAIARGRRTIAIAIPIAIARGGGGRGRHWKDGINVQSSMFGGGEGSFVIAIGIRIGKRLGRGGER